jgi:large subunit ribosomal protein L2
MPVKKMKPTSSGTRHASRLVVEELSKERSPKALRKAKKRTNGRNNTGRITMRRRGGGHKRQLRTVDFKRNKDGVPGVVAAIDYDPNRSANLARVKYLDGEWRYILHPRNVKVGDTVISGEIAEVKPGNAMPLRSIPLGQLVHNVELKPGKGGQLARSAGSWARLAAKEGDWGHLRLPSGEVRLVNLACRATIGQVALSEKNQVVLGKAGRKRWLGRRPKVRGVSMNPVDHPHGGGEGRTAGGRHPVSPWGKLTKGKRTRKKTNRYVVLGRRRGKQAGARVKGQVKSS